MGRNFNPYVNEIKIKKKKAGKKKVTGSNHPNLLKSLKLPCFFFVVAFLVENLGFD
jgi:hypothetical protein